MKFTFTKFKRAVGLAAVGVVSLLGGKVNAQICSASMSWGCSNTYQYGGDIDAITIANNAGTLASYSGLKCTSTSSTNTLLNAGAPIDITAGENITFTITGTTDPYGWGYNSRIGIWIDADRNNSFSTSECISNPTSGPFGVIATTPTTHTIKMPCWTSTGASTMRFVGSMSPYTLGANNGCGTIQSYGNILDVAVTLKVGTPPVANFVVPTGPNWEKTMIKFNANNPNTFYDYKWTYQTPLAIGAATGTVGRASWNAAGNYDVKLLLDYCGVKDSIIKTVTISTPTQVPTADFIAKSNEVEIYYEAEMLDLSTFGPFKWTWEATSPTGITSTSTAQNPKFFLDELGKWDFCLTSENSKGASTKVCKSKYVECIPPSEYYMGPSKEGNNKTGILYDNGGPMSPYGNNRKPSIDYFKILPCGAKEIRLKFRSLKLADAGDKLVVYDADQPTPGKEITPTGGITGANFTTWRTRTLTAYSGAMYITFESNGSGNDSGFIAVWESDLAPPVPPSASYTTAYNPAANGTTVDFINTSKASGSPEYEWIIDGIQVAFSKDLSQVFTTDGNYDVCLVARTCTGADTSCSTFTVVTPTGPGTLDYTASNVRPNVGEVVDFNITTDYANYFEWNIFPTTYTVVSGALNSFNKKLSVRFNAGGCYTFTLKATNTVGGSATEKKVIKNKYVCVLDYCIPLADLISSDIGMNEVTLSKDGNTLIYNKTTSGVQAYNSYLETHQATLTFGATYKLDVERLTNSNSINYKAWIDFNIDGDFDDAGEEIMSSGTISGFEADGTFTVPNISASFEGPTRLRVGASYGSFSNKPCGVNVVGEFEDYRIFLRNDNAPPVITLSGKDTVYVEKNSNPTACWSEVATSTYSAMDPTEGDMTSKVILTSDLDCSIPGIYSIEFNVTDASGNKAATKRRTVYVVLDKTPPVLTLNGNATETVEQCGTFTDPMAVAIDANDGNISSAIIVSGSVNTSVVGDYVITYTVSDAQGNTASKTRTVKVVDTKKPGIYDVGNRIVNNTTVKVQIQSTFVDNIYGLDECNGQIAVTKTPGFNGPVNTAVRATYPVFYYSVDPNGNEADEHGFVINYQVDDYIAPEIKLNTEDILYHDVNTPYISRDVTVSDNYYPLSKVSVVKTGAVDPYTLGTYTETYTATDESGNVATSVRTVIVVDRVAPQILAPSMNVCVGTPFWAMSGLVLSDNYYSPSVLSGRVSVLNHNVNIWEAGVYYINYMLSDPSGNQAMMVTRPVFVNYPPNCQNTFLSTSSLTLDEAVNVFPNPTSGVVKLSYALTNAEPVSVEVFNIQGSKVASVNNLKAGLGFTEIDLGKFGSGVYQIRLTNNGQSTTKKVIVQN